MERPELADLMAQAVETCSKRGMNFTPIRRSVLEALAAANEPLSAYDIADKLSVTKSVRLPTVYRALEFLIDIGLVCHVGLRQAYMVREQPLSGYAVALLACTRCGHFQEVASEEVERAFAQVASSTGFRPQTRMIEMEGYCCDCQEQAASQAL